MQNIDTNVVWFARLSIDLFRVKREKLVILHKMKSLMGHKTHGHSDHQKFNVFPKPSL